jgi:hypothetical protein
MQKLYVVNVGPMRHTLQIADELLRNLPTAPFRSRETHYSSQQLQGFVKMGLLKIVAQEKELREVPLGRGERRSDEVALYDTLTGEKVFELCDIQKGRLYEAKSKDTKQVEAYYNIYRLTFSNRAEVVQAIKDELSEIYRNLK